MSGRTPRRGAAGPRIELPGQHFAPHLLLPSDFASDLPTHSAPNLPAERLPADLPAERLPTDLSSDSLPAHGTPHDLPADRLAPDLFTADDAHRDHQFDETLERSQRPHHLQSQHAGALRAHPLECPHDP